MPLNSVDFVPKGPVKSADIQQFFNLFTGVMIDQPVTFSNVLNVGGNQGNTTVPLKIYGASGQTSHLIDLYVDRTQAQPGFGFSATGDFAWGPGGTAAQDTTLSRIGTQNGGADTPGLLIAPALQINGNLALHGSITFPSGAAIADGGAGGVLNVGVDLAVQSILFVGFDHQQYFNEVGAGLMGVNPTLLIHGANAAGSGITYANAHLQTRSDDMPDVVGSMTLVTSAYTFAANWLQLNHKFYKVTAGVGWPGVALLLDYDVDSNGGAPGGRISMLNGKVGIGPNIVAAGGDQLQVFGPATINGVLSVAGGPNSNSPGAQLVFPQGVGAKLCLYDAGSNSFFGMGIDSAEMYACVPTNNTFNVRYDNGSGAIALGVAPSGVTIGTSTPALAFGTDGACLVTRQAVGGQGHALVVNNPGSGLAILNDGLTFWTPTDPQAGGQLYRVIQPSTRPASSVGGGEVHIAIRLYVDGDITAGTYVHGISFISTSDPRQKSGMTVIADTACMARIRDPSVSVYSYSITPPVPGSVPTPNPTSIGFDATDVYANSPEFTALDQNAVPVSVIYGQMAALLWGALRNLDQRCTAKGI
jgi:hypothetical protein